MRRCRIFVNVEERCASCGHIPPARGNLGTFDETAVAELCLEISDHLDEYTSPRLAQLFELIQGVPHGSVVRPPGAA